MARITKYKDTKTVVDADGNTIEEKKVERTWTMEKSGEPDFVKLYPEAWMPKKKTLAEDESPAGKKTAAARRKNAGDGEDTAHLKLPAAYRFLFFVLAARMDYCDSDDLAHSQLVITGEPYRDEILEIMGWSDRDSLQKGLRALCECNAIRKVSRGCYQINPRFASKGQWKYNPRIPQSNVEGLKKYYDDEQAEARMNQAQAEKEKKKEARKNRKKSPGTRKTGEGNGHPEPAAADIPPAGEAAVEPPPAVPASTETDESYDDGRFSEVLGKFHK